MTVADYLVWEADQTERHEFVGGETFAMAGTEDRHVTMPVNLAFTVRDHLTSTLCRTFINDICLSVSGLGSYFYTDIMATFSVADLASSLATIEPKLIDEVLSPCAAAYVRS